MGLKQEKQAIKTSHQLGSRNGWCPNHTRETHGLFPIAFSASHPHESLTKRNQPSSNTVYIWLVVDLPTPLKNDGKPIEL
jgi:hypothetical protein